MLITWTNGIKLRDLLFMPFMILWDALQSLSIVEEIFLIKVIRNDLNINIKEIFHDLTYIKNYANIEQIEICKQSAINFEKKWVGNLIFFEKKKCFSL